MSDSYNYREDNIQKEEFHMSSYPRNLIAEVADDFIERNHFSSIEIMKIRQAEYTSKTVREFWAKVEKI